MLTNYNNPIIKQIINKNYKICYFMISKYTNYKLTIISHNFFIKNKFLLFIFLWFCYINYLYKLDNIDKCKVIIDIYINYMIEKEIIESLLKNKFLIFIFYLHIYKNNYLISN